MGWRPTIPAPLLSRAICICVFSGDCAAGCNRVRPACGAAACLRAHTDGLAARVPLSYAAALVYQALPFVTRPVAGRRRCNAVRDSHTATAFIVRLHFLPCRQHMMPPCFPRGRCHLCHQCRAMTLLGTTPTLYAACCHAAAQSVAILPPHLVFLFTFLPVSRFHHHPSLMLCRLPPSSTPTWRARFVTRSYLYQYPVGTLCMYAPLSIFARCAVPYRSDIAGTLGQPYPT